MRSRRRADLNHRQQTETNRCSTTPRAIFHARRDRPSFFFRRLNLAGSSADYRDRRRQCRRAARQPTDASEQLATSVRDWGGEDLGCGATLEELLKIAPEFFHDGEPPCVDRHCQISRPKPCAHTSRSIVQADGAWHSAGREPNECPEH